MVIANRDFCVVLGIYPVRITAEALTGRYTHVYGSVITVVGVRLPEVERVFAR